MSFFNSLHKPGYFASFPAEIIEEAYLAAPKTFADRVIQVFTMGVMSLLFIACAVIDIAILFTTKSTENTIEVISPGLDRQSDQPTLRGLSAEFRIGARTGSREQVAGRSGRSGGQGLSPQVETSLIPDEEFKAESENSEEAANTDTWFEVRSRTSSESSVGQSKQALFGNSCHHQGKEETKEEQFLDYMNNRKR